MIDIVNRGAQGSAGVFLRGHKKHSFQYFNFNLSYLTEYILAQHETLQIFLKYTEFH